MTDGLYFDEREANRAELFFDKLLYHVEGEWAGKHFTLLDWQRNDLIRPLFGWRRADGTRRYRRAYVEIPRKNGKSTLAAGIALYLLFMDDEPGAQVFSAAADRDQARIVFNTAKAMVETSPELSSFGRVYRNTITVPMLRGSYRALSADAYTKHGLNAHGIIFDELHAQPNRDLWDVLNTSTGARRQPLLFQITTAGFDQNSICWEQREYARGVLNGTIDDTSYFGFIAAATPEDDWRQPATWEKANPSIGQTVKREYLAEECKRAQQSPAYENTFKRLHLNIWTAQETRWLPLEKWDACASDTGWELDGQECYAGIDLSTTTDLSALSLVFPDGDGQYRTLQWFWMPDDSLHERERRDGVPYGAWQREGWIEATPGNVIDYDFIEAQVLRLCEQHDVREVAYDPWNATALVLRLQEKGLTMVPVRQGFASLSAPSKEFEKLIVGGRLLHQRNPVMRWMVDNVTVASDPAGNIKPVKPDRAKSTKRIDGVVATVIALDRAVRNADQGGANNGVMVWG